MTVQTHPWRFLVFGALVLGVCAGCRAKKKQALPSKGSGARARKKASAFGRCPKPALANMLDVGENNGDHGGRALPFAVEVGSGSLLPGGGFGLGLIEPKGGRPQASVLMLDGKGRKQAMVPLRKTVGDTRPPQVVAGPGGAIFGLLESSGKGRSLQVGQVKGNKAVWGPNFRQSRDESMAYHLASGKLRTLAVWDDYTKLKPVHGVIRLASFDGKDLGAVERPRVVSPKDSDAESPRLVPRKGGFWLVWIARRPEEKKVDGRHRAEVAEFRWLEALAIDEHGRPKGEVRALTPNAGHVLTYAASLLPNGKVLVVYRDDDKPSGSSGGSLYSVSFDEEEQGQVDLWSEQAAGGGSPFLLPGWLALAGGASDTQLIPLGPNGERLGPPSKERTLGQGQPFAAKENQLLVVQPRGLAMRVFLAKCDPKVAVTAPAVSNSAGLPLPGPYLPVGKGPAAPTASGPGSRKNTPKPPGPKGKKLPKKPSKPKKGKAAPAPR